MQALKHRFFIGCYSLSTLLLVLFSQPALSNAENSDIKRSIKTLLASKQLPLLMQQDFSRQSDDLARLYRLNAHELVWLGEDRSEKNREDALNLLSNSASQGLNPGDYDAEALRGYLQQAVLLPKTAAKELASYDIALSVALLRFIHDVAEGRIDPLQLNYPSSFRPKSNKATISLLSEYLKQQSLNDLPTAIEPKLKQYQQLKQALTIYRQQSIPKADLNIKSLHPGEQHPQLPALRQRLIALQAMTAEDIAGITDTDFTYDAPSIAAIMRLQQQQGLNADGVIGRQTTALLNQSSAEKTQLLALAMERMRWLPSLPAGPQIHVNIPAFRLWAYHEPEEQNPLTMKVVVGKADHHQTPVLLEEMRYLEFMPFWNIPKSIMDQEIMPKMQSDRQFMRTQEIELVELADDDEDSAENPVDNIKHGRVRARQRPGKKNPLGKVKFVFPNKADVYLHDTPSRGAFTRDRRDLSHGCVRVSEAEKLAEFVLSQQSGWDKQAIALAMEGPKTQHVSLKKSIPVLFFYSTAFVDQDNQARFYTDIYGYDAQLQEVLSKPPQADGSRLLISKNTASANFQD